jgi:phosphomannomutase
MPDAVAKLLAVARAWRDDDPDTETRAELDAIVARVERGDPAAGIELADRFDGRVGFGTAGLRAPMGAGPTRLNRVVVRQAAAGLAAWLGPGRRVVIGHDARHRSDVFAEDSARVLAAAGIEVSTFSRTCPTPMLAFAVRHLRADAGVMCTASHNPPTDNGYKLYAADGAQVVPPDDRALADAMAVAGEHPIALADDATMSRAVTVVGDEVERAYLDHVAALASDLAPADLTDAARRDLRIVYTPLYGVGGETAVVALQQAGFSDVHVVAAQRRPDPDFGGLAFPNPEEPGVLDAACALAAEVDAHLVLAHDPDADRLAVAVPSPSAGVAGSPPAWTPLTGNQIGALLAQGVLAATSGADRLVVTTIVSSRLLSRLAAAVGVHEAEVPTGFKWVVRPALTHPDWRFVFGYEEALGFSVDPYVRDKDGMSAAVCLAQIVAAHRAAGRSVDDALDDLARRFGAHVTASWSWRVGGPDAARRMGDLMAGLRADPPTELGGSAVIRLTDLAAGDGAFPPADVVVLDLEDGSRVCVRPSGTEPKLKLYLEVVEAVGAEPDAVDVARAEGQARVDRLLGDVQGRLRAPVWT